MDADRLFNNLRADEALQRGAQLSPEDIAAWLYLQRERALSDQERELWTLAKDAVVKALHRGIPPDRSGWQPIKVTPR